MEKIHRAKRARTFTTAIVIAAASGAAGCGEESDYANEPRPPSPITVSAAITDKDITVSPRSFGAGPVTLIVTNQTQRAQEVTLETKEIGGSAPGIEQRSGPINPGDTASLKANLREGTYSVGVEGAGVGAASLSVGGQRPSAQDELLQP